jgi:hypothetical protein
MNVSAQMLRDQLSRNPRASGQELAQALGGVHRSTLSRLLAQFGDEIVRRGGSRRARYALRRRLRGALNSLPIYRIDEAGDPHLAARLDLISPNGSALSFAEPFAWPLESGLMSDGWFEGLPYPLLDMQPQGFLGRNFAHHYARELAVSENPSLWSDDDVVYVLSSRGEDVSGNWIVGDLACQRHLDARQNWESNLVGDQECAQRYPQLAQQALAQGIVGSSAAGEFPKFTAQRLIHAEPVSVIVKFSGNDQSNAVQRWSDLLVCEHLALETLADTLNIPAAKSQIQQHAGRTFLEVQRFDRVGAHGRKPICSLASINADLIGAANPAWTEIAQTLQKRKWMDAEQARQIQALWWFGKLIANTDMHDGNLSFMPGLRVAPAYDMLPMLYAPISGGEVPPRTYQVTRALPSEAEAWNHAAQAAITFWQRSSQDSRISEPFRAICRENQERLQRAVGS